MQSGWNIVLMLCCALAFSAQAHDSREVVGDIATLIENNYFDETKANELARDLRNTARAGTFDRFVQPRDLASALTSRLQQVDRHFNVFWVQGRAAWSDRISAGNEAPRVFGGESYGFRTVSMLPGGIGYIDIRSFAYVSARADEPARLAADAALQLIANASAVIIDLRNCIGGYAQMSSYLVSSFTAADAEIFNVVHRRDGIESERPALPYRQPRTNVPLYVLVSGTTASAGESAAYTLQAAKRALIVGERTSGAANPGGSFPVRDGFNVFISIGTPINPITKTNWEAAGVTPDVTVASELALDHAQRLALERLLGDASGVTNLERTWALEALHARTRPPRGLVLPQYVGRYGEAEISMSNGTLQLRRGRRAVLTLTSLRADEFFVAGEPTQRVVFERDSKAAITGFQLVRSSTYSMWFPRDE